jgi:hypothetical protein
MTAKEKAKELVDRFYFNGIEEIEYSMQYEDGIQCALICVDEILKNIPKEVMSYNPFMMNTDYWQEVKQEINKL